MPVYIFVHYCEPAAIGVKGCRHLPRSPCPTHHPHLNSIDINSINKTKFNSFNELESSGSFNFHLSGSALCLYV